MKTLKKVKLINWHYIWNETIPIEPVVFLTGHTGAGKSTIIDAMQIVLLGDTRGTSFNKAANDKSARTLKGYLRGELNDTIDGYNYLRPGRFSSYIALEYYDDVNDDYFTLGVVFDVYDDGSEQHKFFCLQAQIPPNEFINEKKVPLSYAELHQYFKTNYPNKYKFFDSNAAYQEFIKQQFGGLKQKYFGLFKKAVSFVPIIDITKFITEFVCDEQTNINIEKMQENIVQYKRLETEAINMQRRIDGLEEIERAYKAYQEIVSNTQLYQYIIDRSTYEIELGQEKTLVERKTRYQTRLRAIEQTLTTNKEIIRDLQEKKVRIIESRALSTDYDITSDIRKQKEDSSRRLLEIQNNVERVKTNFDSYFRNYIDAATRICTTLEKADLSLVSNNESEAFSRLLKISKTTIEKCKHLQHSLTSDIASIDDYLLKEWRDTLSEFKRCVSEVNVSIGRTRTEIDRKISYLRQQETGLQSGRKAYDPSISNVRKTLQERLSEAQGRDISVDFFADLFDIRDEKWVNAAEGYLSSQRFSLFVDPRYYLKAYTLLREIQSSFRFYGAILVDQEKLIQNGAKAQPNSLAEEVITDHVGAGAYANFLLGRLIKCSTPEEARNSGNGITPFGDLYRNYNLSQINPKLYENHYIGRSVSGREILAKQKEILNLSELASLYKQLHDVITDASSLDVLSSYEIDNSLELLAKIGEVAGLKQNIKFLEDNLQSTSDDDGKTSHDQQLDLIDADIKTAEDENAQLHQERGTIESNIKNIDEEKIPAAKLKINEIKSRLDEFDPFFVEEEAAPAFEALLAEGKTFVDISSDYATRFSTIQYRANSTFNEVKRLRKQYVSDYRLSHDVETTNNKVFADELADFRDVKLPEYQAKIHDAYEKAISEFKDDFLDKLRSSIDAVEDQIDELNAAIQEPTFGKDKYRFSVKPSYNYRKYYDMIKDEILLQKDGNDAFFEKYSDTIEDLFMQITTAGSTADSVIQRNIDAFTDYRTYLDFDLIVTDENGNEQRLSKTIRTKSGGETQTPFYIAVLASFVQLYRVKPNQPDDASNNTTRLIVFDEAFSKMDSNRIKESIRLLRSLNLQVIISAPDDKIADISGLVDETLVVIRHEQKTYVKQFKDENLN